MQETTINPKNEPFTRSVDTQRLVAFLRDTEPNEVITYDKIEEVAKVACQSGGAGYPMLLSARRILERDGVIFDTKTGVGLVRLTDSGKLKLVASSVHSIHRRASKSITRASKIEVANLDKDDMFRYVANVSLLSVLKEATQHKTVARLQSQAKSTELFAINDTLEFLKG